MFPPGIEPGTFCVLGRCDNHYTTENRWKKGVENVAKPRAVALNLYKGMFLRLLIIAAFDSSVGRAVDCSWKTKQTSIGHWFESGSKENFFFRVPSKAACVFFWAMADPEEGWSWGPKLFSLLLAGPASFFPLVSGCLHEPILVSIVVSIPACHAGDRGSIPPTGRHTFLLAFLFALPLLLCGWVLCASGGALEKPPFKCQRSMIQLRNSILQAVLYLSIVGSVVECSPATRAARVRFPDDA